MLVHIDDRLFIVNVGDSRAAVADSQGRTLLLTDEHSYGAAGGLERERLAGLCHSDGGRPLASPQSGWRIRVLDGERITMEQGITCVEYDYRPAPPGQRRELERLVPTRAFGHSALKDSGLLTAEPSISMLELRPSEEYTVLLASDGIWDMCSKPEEVWDCVASCDDEDKAQAVVDWASQRWQQFWTYEFNGQVYGKQRIPSPDDCSAVVLTLRGCGGCSTAANLDQLEADESSSTEVDEMSASLSDGPVPAVELL